MLEEDVLATLDDDGRSDIDRSEVSGIRSNWCLGIWFAARLVKALFW